jgi:ferric-dicitrate binding protein FerR (iron transport regulator)
MDSVSPLCPSCGQPIQEGWENCASCGEPLSLPSRVVVDRAGRPTPRWLDRSRQRAGALKAEGEVTSQVRLGSFQQIDDVRESEQTRAAKARAREDRQALAIAGLAAAVFVLLIVVFAIVSLF